jgi:hypothetical protein
MVCKSGATVPKLFISYRREDSAGLTGRLFDRLQSHFGRESVFIDVDSIPFGVDFRNHLTDAVGKCDALLAVIGDRWTTISHGGEARLDDPNDFVRVEIEAALARNIPVIPVLVGKTPMPHEEDLTPSLRPLIYRQACNLDLGQDFHVHVDRLIRGLEQLGYQRNTQANMGLTAEEPHQVPGVLKPPGTNTIRSVVEIVSGPAKGTTYELTKDRVLIGRGTDCDINRFGPEISHYHAQFVRTEDGYQIEDLRTRNGTHINGSEVRGRVLLHSGDRIHVGATILVYRRLGE